jgi:hypothetical protein
MACSSEIFPERLRGIHESDLFALLHRSQTHQHNKSSGRALFLFDLMKRDLTVDGYNRHLYALRPFFDFVYMGGVVDAAAPLLCEAAWLIA